MNNEILPWLAGPVECLECGREWVAVRQLGVPIHCPDCDSQEVLIKESEE